jgi:rubrerythrin
MPFLQVEQATIDAMRAIHRLRELNAWSPTFWTDLDRLLESLCGPMERKRRCGACNATGRDYVTGTCSTCKGHGYVILGTERQMDCPACGEDSK